MRTYKLSFDYEGCHYDIKLQIKIQGGTETGFALTKRPYNNDWWLDNHNDRDSFFASYEPEGCDYLFEVQLGWKHAEFLHLRIWEKDENGVLLDDEGGVENFKVLCHGML